MMTLYGTKHTLSGTLQPVAPFDFAKTIGFISGFYPTMGEQQIGIGADQSTLTKAVIINGQIVAFRIASEGTTEQPRLTYTLISERPLNPELIERALDRIRFYLSLDDDLQPFYAAAMDDPPFARVVAKLYGFHQVKFLTPFEHFCWAILTQRTPIAMAQKMKVALTKQFGSVIELDGSHYAAFPEAHVLAEAGAEQLLATIQHARKADYLAELARQFLTLDEAFLRYGPYDAVRESLLRLKGIGPWSANFVMIRGLGRVERSAEEDRLIAAGEACYQQTLTRADVLRLASRYGDQQAYWSIYLRVNDQRGGEANPLP